MHFNLRYLVPIRCFSFIFSITKSSSFIEFCYHSLEMLNKIRCWHRKKKRINKVYWKILQLQNRPLKAESLNPKQNKWNMSISWPLYIRNAISVPIVFHSYWNSFSLGHTERRWTNTGMFKSSTTLMCK